MIKRFIRDIGHYVKKLHFQDKWRSINKHNFTIANEIFNINKVVVGNYTYANLNVHCYGNDNEKLIIGNFCSISDEVHFILGGNHNFSYISTYPFKKKINGGNNESYTKGPIIIEDDVWIGYGCKILSGVTIGKGCVIGAGSVVTKDVPPYSIYVGNKVIKRRFDDEIIESAMKLNYNKLTKKDIKNKLNLLYTTISKHNIDKIVEEVNSDGN